jgi:hypothetical protein
MTDEQDEVQSNGNGNVGKWIFHAVCILLLSTITGMGTWIFNSVEKLKTANATMQTENATMKAEMNADSVHRSVQALYGPTAHESLW